MDTHISSGGIKDEIVRRYIFRLYPTAEQCRILHEQRQVLALLWNALKQRREDHYRRAVQKDGTESTHKTLTFFDMTNEITGLRHECPEWAAIPAVTAHRVARHLDEAFAAFFRRLREEPGEDPGYPQWKRSAKATTIPLGTMDKTGWHLEQRTDNPRSWLLHYKSVTEQRDKNTWIHGRGVLPGEVKSWRNADIIWRDGAWWLSVCVCMAGSRRTPGRQLLTIRFGGLGELARVNGVGVNAGAAARTLRDDILDELKSERDRRWPRLQARSDSEQCSFREAQGEIARLHKCIRRGRLDALHVWTASIVRRASMLIVEVPQIKLHTRSPRGDKKAWGANVATVSEINRDILSRAPAAAVAMLKYKAKEAGIPCDIRTIETPEIAVGADLVASGKALRKTKRIVNQASVAA